MRLLRLALAALAALALGAGAAQARPPVWVVRDKDSELVLFGSVHLLPPGLDWRPQALKTALARADDVWFELPIDAATQAKSTQLAMQLGALPADQSLFRMLPKDVGERVTRMAKAYGVDLALLDRLKPWLAEVALSDAAYRKDGAGGADGVERILAAEAPARAQRRAFESADQQIAILAGAPISEQIASLAETAREMEEEPQQYRGLLRAWMAGDLKSLDRQALEPMRKTSPSLFRTLLVDRNARWTQALDRRLKGRGRTVVVVGMAHLIGPEGLPARLRALGYRVEGP
jgi:uncharacterized protein YbaP (TraB family)